MRYAVSPTNSRVPAALMRISGSPHVGLPTWIGTVARWIVRSTAPLVSSSWYTGEVVEFAAMYSRPPTPQAMLNGGAGTAKVVMVARSGSDSTWILLAERNAT